MVISCRLNTFLPLARAFPRFSFHGNGGCRRWNRDARSLSGAASGSVVTRPRKLKTIGLLGGSSDVATVEYYKFLNKSVNDKLGGYDIAETLIAGMNFGNVEAFVRSGDWDGYAEYLKGKVAGLAAGGADVFVCVSNTTHKSLETFEDSFPIPMIHIVDPTGAAIKAQGLSKVALFGTRPVMQQDYIKARYRERFGVEAVAPTDAEQKEIDSVIFDELVKGIVKEESKARYIEIAERMRRDQQVEGLILGCTEIFLLIDQVDMPDFPVFNTTTLHCEAAVDFALAEEKE